MPGYAFIIQGQRWVEYGQQLGPWERVYRDDQFTYFRSFWDARDDLIANYRAYFAENRELRIKQVVTFKKIRWIDSEDL